MSARTVLAAAIAAALFSTAGAQDAEQDAAPVQAAAGSVEVISVTTARRREESAQEIPIPVSVIGGDLVLDTGTFNVNRLQSLVPSLQFYSSNPRNTSVNIRGLGLPYGLTNDGIESGVGYYVDGVLYARPASTTMDFIDVERIEVLRGPQSTLFGKNVTAGAILVTTRKPSFTPETNVEVSVGDDNYAQAKASISGPFSENVAGRLSFSGTQRDGNLYHVNENRQINDLDNTGVRAQLLIRASTATDITLALDYTTQDPVGYAQVLAGVTPTWRGTPGYGSELYGIAANPSANAARGFWQIIDDLNYVPPNMDPATQDVRPFDRVVDTGTEWRSGNDIGGASFNLDSDVGGGTLTVTTAWRFWDWDPSNDRDYLALEVGTLSQAPSEHEQLTQEIRWAGEFTADLSAVFGFFAFDQQLSSNPVHTEAVGVDYARFRNPNLVAQWGPNGSVYPNYFAGQRSEITSELDSVSAALFGQLDWALTDRLHLLPGLRYNYDKKEVYFNQRALGIPDPALFAPTPPPPAADHPYSNSGDIFREDDDTNVSGQLTLAFHADGGTHYYATVATAFKSIGVNLGGGPAIEIPPEDVSHIEIGLKSSPTDNSIANLTLFSS
ncbi:MAG TPA: TonB-dependent receptor, partial [Vicinamibacterales bacterium]